MATKPVTLGWQRGMNNIVADIELPSNTLRDAVNVDVLDNGAVRRRKGATLRHAAHGAHSLWSNDSVAYFVADGNLMQLMPDMTSRLIREHVGPAVMQYEEINNEVFFTNNSVIGRVRDGVAYELGVEMPGTPPVVNSGFGYLAPGAYQVVCTFVNKHGEESACGRTAKIVLDAPGGVYITAPQPASPEVGSVRVYMTQPNGDVFYEVADLSVGDTTAIFDSVPDFGPVCRTQFMARMFAAETMTYYRGRMYYVAGNIVWYSEPFQFGLINPSENFIVFGAPITLIGATSDGIYVASEQTYFLNGVGPKEFTLQPVFPFGAAQFSLTKHPRSTDLSWYSCRGITIASDTGKAALVQNENVMPDAALRGATLVREHDSLNQIVSAVSGSPGISSLAAMDYMDAEVIRARG